MEYNQLLIFCKKAGRLSKKEYPDMLSFKKAQKIKGRLRKNFLNKYAFLNKDAYIFPGKSFKDGVIITEDYIEINWENMAVS